MARRANDDHLDLVRSRRGERVLVHELVDLRRGAVQADGRLEGAVDIDLDAAPGGCLEGQETNRPPGEAERRARARCARVDGGAAEIRARARRMPGARLRQRWAEVVLDIEGRADRLTARIFGPVDCPGL